MRPDISGPPSERVRHARHLFAGISRGYDVMSEVLSLGQNRRWRGVLVSRVPVGSFLLDVATGTASVAMEAARHRDARVVGLDQSEPMLRSGRDRVRRGGLHGRVRLVLGQAERLPFPARSFDAITFTYLLRYVDDPEATLAEMARVLRSGGVMSSLEFHVPPKPVWRGGWYVHTRLALPLLGRLASPDWYAAGRFLGPSVAGFVERYPLAEQARMWRAAGMERIRARPLLLGSAMVMYGVKR